MTALITLAAISASIFSILQMVSTRFGVGLPNADVPDSHMTIILKVSLFALGIFERTLT
jgi:uncharacterized membrane protein